jgi:LytS/YehU family sensor histidine kinase
MAFAGIFQFAIGLIMFFAPQIMIPIWPWKLTPLTSRVIGGWFALPGWGGIMIARESRWSAIRITLQGTMLYTTLLLIGVWRAWADFDTSNPLTWAYIGMLLVSTIGIGILYFVMERQRIQKQV